jgi:hypothetical protein
MEKRSGLCCSLFFITILNLLLLSSSIPCIAEERVDIKGWNNTHWGMTEKDIAENSD